MILRIRYYLLLRSLRQCSPLPFVRRYSDRKQESYFSAIGGESDEPPPDLSPQQVNTILRTNEMIISSSIKPIKLIECNQLASNHPIEDRLRISKFNERATKTKSESTLSSDSLLLAVFDGHGGGSCADVVSRRLFHYIALTLKMNSFNVNLNDIGFESLVQDLYFCPNSNYSMNAMYDKSSAEYLNQHLIQSERKALERYAQQIVPTDDIWVALKNSFERCDRDLAEEIEHNLLHSSSNILLHYYLSLAVSGCCVTLLLIRPNKVYIASCGDCRAVLGIHSHETNSSIKTIDLSKEHNSDNISELKRVLSEHPKSEQNNVVRNDRLLGQLMPLRAFGDFNFKWSLEKIQRLGLTRAFGSHVIPPYYITPPYLTSTPEIDEMNIENDKSVTNKYIILATDGLWEHFESARKVVKCVNRFKERLKKPEPKEIIENQEVDKNPILSETGETLSDSTKTSLNSSETIMTERNIIVDTNSATYLIRTALGDSPSSDPHVDDEQLQQQRHSRLVTYLTLPQSVVRNFRDDISLIVIEMSSS